jgi:hypothetical protein
MFIVCTEAASSLEKLLCGRSLCGPAHSIRATLSCSFLVDFMTSVVTFCLQRRMYAVINKASGGPADLRRIFSFFLTMLATFQCEHRNPCDRHLNTGFLCFLSLEANTQPARKRQAAVAFFSCSPPNLNS